MNIQDELNELYNKYGIESNYVDKINMEIMNGMIDSMSEIEFLEYTAKTILSYSSREPAFSNISSEIQYKLYEMTIGRDYLDLVKKQYDNRLVGEQFYNFVNENSRRLEEIIIWERDKLIDYFVNIY